MIGVFLRSDGVFRPLAPSDTDPSTRFARSLLSHSGVT
jgi:hypothetical protein